MYHGGQSEEVVSQALAGRKDKVVVASKVSPQHFGYDDVLRSARMSLKRLGLKRMDLEVFRRERGGPFKVLDGIAEKLGKSRSQPFKQFVGKATLLS